MKPLNIHQMAQVAMQIHHVTYFAGLEKANLDLESVGEFETVQDYFNYLEGEKNGVKGLTNFK
ncbi:hypothetical protein [Neptuniibacter sp.]|uniref:hypothetical protein n=1 Tax=Neptuniibacter sp. TaxID=1962643 RepID=UPI0026307ADE|nr:hypothetical protein [Neptuniibacter sp.]MCP4597024.1 hypothetical protein [Neptuniibacter sp.]